MDAGETSQTCRQNMSRIVTLKGTDRHRNLIVYNLTINDTSGGV